MIEKRYEWSCPRQECNKPISAFTEAGMKALRDQHIAQHMRQDREVQIKKVEEVKALPEAKPELPVVFVERDYDILLMTRADLAFLKTRGVKVDDENIQRDLGDLDGVKRKGT
jgi:hypothetical protein